MHMQHLRLVTNDPEMLPAAPGLDNVSDDSTSEDGPVDDVLKSPGKCQWRQIARAARRSKAR